MPRTRALTLLCLTLAGPTAALGQEAVDLELVLAVDISGSIDAQEARQQRQGYIAAIADPTVVDAIRSNMLGRIAITYVEWAGAGYQRIVIPWTTVDGSETAEAFAAALQEAPPMRSMWTSISGAIDFSALLFEDNGFDGTRQVIDVSGDGVNNRGRSVHEARDEAVARDITINGLPILNDRPQPFSMATPIEIGLDRYYAESVIGGPGAFMIAAEGFDEFKTAILSKLIREIATGPTDHPPTAGQVGRAS